MKSKRQGFRIEIYWEEFGNAAEGGMEDRRYHEIVHAPTPAQMNVIEHRLKEILLSLELIPRTPKKKKR